MPYEKSLSSKNPGCILFLVDQSVSMKEPWDTNLSEKKEDQVSNILNRFLREISLRCAKGEEIKNRIHVGVVGYGKSVASVFSGRLSGAEIVGISEIANNPLRMELRNKKESDGDGGVIETSVRVPIWIEPTSEGYTPMKEAFLKAKEMLLDWIHNYPNGYPPIVINITDGQYTSGDPSEAAKALKFLSTTDGSTLLFNIHISASSKAQILLPASADVLSDKYALELFEMSSDLPTSMLGKATELYPGTSPGARGFTFNGDFVSLVNFLDIGSTLDFTPND